MSLNDKFGGMYRKGGVLYYTICAHVPETQKCVTLVAMWHSLHSLLRCCTACCDVTLITLTARFTRCFVSIPSIVNMQLRWFFSTLMHFFRISCILPFFYPNFSSNFAPQFKIIARSSHVHRVTIAHTYTCNTRVAAESPSGGNLNNKIIQDLQDYFGIQRVILVILLNFVLFKITTSKLYYSTSRALFSRFFNEQALFSRLFFYSTTRNNRPKAVVKFWEIGRRPLFFIKNQPVYFVLYIMAKKDKKVNAWQIIVAVFQALAALFGSLKKSHDIAHEASSEDPEGDE